MTELEKAVVAWRNARHAVVTISHDTPKEDRVKAWRQYAAAEAGLTAKAAEISPVVK